jgi:hypothetical protein
MKNAIVVVLDKSSLPDQKLMAASSSLKIIPNKIPNELIKAHQDLDAVERIALQSLRADVRIAAWSRCRRYLCRSSADGGAAVKAAA